MQSIYQSLSGTANSWNNMKNIQKFIATIFVFALWAILIAATIIVPIVYVLGRWD
jgi:hypothetical protein